MKKNIIRHNYQITITDRQESNGHKSFLIWFTGLSGSGKSTIANGVEYELHKQRVKTYTLDGDNIRRGLNSDLTFTPEDRSENIRRIGETANLMIDAGIIVLAAFVSPYKKDRERVKKIVKDVNFIEIFVNTSLELCEQRDVKGLYKKARAGEIKNMTGVSDKYENPENPDLEISTDNETIDASVAKVLTLINEKLNK